MSFNEVTHRFNRMNQIQSRRMIRWLLFACMTVAAITFYMNMIHDRAYLEMVLSTNVKKGTFQIYWAGEKQPFSEDQSLKIRIIRGKERRYGLYFTDLTEVSRIRIDPIERPGKVKIHYIVLTQEEITPIKLMQGRLKRLETLRDISNVSHDSDGILVESSGMDPALLWELKPEIIATGRLTKLLRLLVTVFICWLLALSFTSPVDFFVKLRSILWWVVLCLVITMAVTSEFNKHPDEYVHTNASRYYESHWLPPEVCQPGTENSYSVYGVSRLNSKEVVYYLTGKITSMLSFLPMYDYLRIRLFNVLLFILIVLSWHRHKNGAMLFIPLLITPQVWYIFSYSNSDAFACFVALFICQQLVFPNTFLKRCWYAEENESWLFFRTVICGMMFGLILFTKANYYIIYIFFAGYFLIELLFDRGSIQIPWRRVFGFLAGGVIVIMLLYSPHLLVNGLDRKQKIGECREKLASPSYKPSTPLDKKAPSLYWKRKGIPLSYLLEKQRWGERIFRSSIGVYGYTAYSGSIIYYQTMKALMILFGAVVVVLILFLADNKRRLLLVWTIICALLLIGIVLWRCWVGDFQTQGRYLLPILPLVGIMMYKTRTVIDKPIVNLLALFLFLMSGYSFIFIGLVQIPKI